MDPSVCGFAVLVNPVVDKGFVKELKSSDGSMVFLSTGSFKVSYTNLKTGKTITENESGPGTTTVFPDNSMVATLRGVSGSFLSLADAARFGLPPVAVTAGMSTASFAPDGSMTSLSLKGHVLVDVCAALS